MEIMKEIKKYLTPDLLRPEYRDLNLFNPMLGHCYVASEVLYHLWGKYNGYLPCRARDARDVVHWWLEDNEGNILDITKEQYEVVGLIPPYNKGKRGGFLTKRPSKRAKTVIERMSHEGTLHKDIRRGRYSWRVREV